MSRIRTLISADQLNEGRSRSGDPAGVMNVPIHKWTNYAINAVLKRGGYDTEFNRFEYIRWAGDYAEFGALSIENNGKVWEAYITMVKIGFSADAGLWVTEDDKDDAVWLDDDPDYNDLISRGYKVLERLR